jgi:hypothetical protein
VRRIEGVCLLYNKWRSTLAVFKATGVCNMHTLHYVNHRRRCYTRGVSLHIWLLLNSSRIILIGYRSFKGPCLDISPSFTKSPNHPNYSQSQRNISPFTPLFSKLLWFYTLLLQNLQYEYAQSTSH